MIEEGTIFFLTDFETTGVDDFDLPIEIGCLVLNHEFNILETFESMIKWPELFDELENFHDNWPARYNQAFSIHKISAGHYKTNARDLTFVSRSLINLINKYKTKERKVIIVSDNAQFEYKHMKKIFDAIKDPFPFHYCAWDTSLLLEILGVGDPKDVAHRALNDCYGLYKHLVLAYGKLKELCPIDLF